MSQSRGTETRRLTRRTVLGIGLATAGLTAVPPLLAQGLQTHMPPGVTPRHKGPLVFLDYDKEELDAAYDQIPWAPNAEDLGERMDQQSAAALARLGPPRRFAYGSTAIERLDLYATKQPKAPMNVFIHGGAWRGGDAAGSAYISETFVDAGAHFIALDFNNVTETNGNLVTMVEQVRRAVAWVYKNAASIGGDAARLYVSGVSSGAHLTAVVLTTDWTRDFGLPVDTVKGALCCSGMYDLHPVSLSSRGRYVTFTDDIVDALSPQRHLDRIVTPVIVAHGTRETPEFQRQNRDFAAALKAAGKQVTFLVGEGHNHFELQETLGNPYSLLGRAVLRQMMLARQAA